MPIIPKTQTYELSIVIPTQNSSEFIVRTIYTLREFSANYNWEIIFIENGSYDDSFSKIFKTINALKLQNFRVIQSPPGIGIAVITGINIAKGKFIHVTGDDLPFGVEDLTQSLALLLKNPENIFIGSKFHDYSQVHRAFYRNVITKLFYLARRLLFCSSIQDTQGSISFENNEENLEIALNSEFDLLWSTRFTIIAERKKNVVEYPVQLSQSHDKHKSRIQLTKIPIYTWRLIIFRFKSNHLK